MTASLPLLPARSLCLRWIAGLLALLLGACGRNGETQSQGAPETPPPGQLSLSFHAIPECFLCESLRHELAELEERYASRMRFREYDYHLEMSQQGIKRFQLGTHGIVIHDDHGNAFWTWKAHEEMGDSLQNIIERILTSAPAT